MPGISIWMLRLSLIYLLAAFATGSLLLLNTAFEWSPGINALRGVHMETAMLGWILQFALAVAYWVFPRFIKGKNRGNETAAWSMVVMLNLGILLPLVPFLQIWMEPLGRLLLFVAMVQFAWLMASRVVTYRNL